MKAEAQENIDKLRACFACYENFPKPGVQFYDVFPLVGSSEHLNLAIDIFSEHLEKQNIQYSKIFMLESRGFLFGVPLSLKTLKPCFPVRKKGKLPGEVVGNSYKLEYGSDVIQIQKSSINEGDRVIIIDDVLATGGTMNAVIELIQNQGGIVEQCLLVSKIAGLKGDEKLLIPKSKIFSIMDF